MSPPSRLAVAVRLGVAQFVLFAVIGVYVPYWPVWLEDRGWDESSIAWFIAMPSLVRSITSPYLAHKVDRARHKKAVVVGIAASCVLAFLLLPRLHGFLPLLVGHILFYTTFSTLFPLIEHFALSCAHEANVPYGRIRVFGSSGFLVANVATGRLLDGAAPSVLFDAVLAVVAAGALATLLLPTPPHVPLLTPEEVERTPRVASPWRPVLALALVAGLIQSSHGAYYVISTLHWQRLGIDETTIGVLWAIGVLAEIALFAFGAEAMRVIGPRRLLLIGGIVATARWSILPWCESVALLVPLQCLHAASFGATHLASIYLLREVAPRARGATAQAILFAVGGGIGAGAMLASGPIYERFGGGVFFAMSVIAAAGVACGGVLLRRSSAAAPSRG